MEKDKTFFLPLRFNEAYENLERVSTKELVRNFKTAYKLESKLCDNMFTKEIFR